MVDVGEAEVLVGEEFGLLVWESCQEGADGFVGVERDTDGVGVDEQADHGLDPRDLRGRPATVAPKITSSRPVRCARRRAQASWMVMFQRHRVVTVLVSCSVNSVDRVTAW